MSGDADTRGDEYRPATASSEAVAQAASVSEAFIKLYGGPAPRVFRAPGRVNLIGEHTDYNEGFVLPMAIDRATTVAARARQDLKVRVHSLNIGETREFDLAEPGRGRRGLWSDYVEGVAQALQEGGARLSGADMVLASDVPEGAGLSSSAALTVSTGLALASVSGLEVDRRALARAAQRAEHTYVGALVGIMDQTVSALGRRGTALLLDCRTLEIVYVPLDTSEVLIAVCDTRVKHELSASEYNTRRAECERGVELLREHLPDVRALRDVSVAEFERHEHHLPEPVRRRCRHVVTENDRTLEAAHALRHGDLAGLGRLMDESHRSLRDDYEVSCRELDVLVEIASSVESVLGARMTGGGFGGCTVNLVRRDALDGFRATVEREYKRATGLDPEIYASEPGDGAREIVGVVAD